MEDWGRLMLVFDTNAIIRPDGLQLFQELARGDRGTLPASLALVVPHIVLMELRHHNATPATQHTARAAYNYLLQQLPVLSAVRHQGQTASDELEATFYPREHGPYGSKNDGLVLLYCLQLHYRSAANIWLVTEDLQLTARAVRSRVACLPLNALRHARDLLRYSVLRPKGDDFHQWHRVPPHQPMTATIRVGRAVAAGEIRFVASDEVQRIAAYRRIVQQREENRGGAWEVPETDTGEPAPVCEQCGCGVRGWHVTQRDSDLKILAVAVFVIGFVIGLLCRIDKEVFRLFTVDSY
ncbi:uncharacterized protein LOC129600272 [Paramacrobiotus metropolitanus]|uniref:uncharacterized protein LOC129600272 n=1 Tax=Paramacrobiotus metropolitanus TaxID=2943436 RepID=UPI002445DE01|nr:uncharacterized protein LOC129600272 [Paramacrobiotus metropolitanus]